MSVTTTTKVDTKRIHKRLLPLYIAAFFQGFVLWYTVEKLFMRSIGFDDATIGLMVAIYSAVILFVEIPSGILADRWSRKGVLILASICLMLSACIGGISKNKPTYVVATILWGMFFAFYSGTYDSIVYDTLHEESGNSSRFEHYFGRINIMDSSALVVSSLLGGVIANWLGLRSVYFITVPLMLISIVALLNFREPTLHKSEVVVPMKDHIFSTYRAILHNKQLFPVLIVLILVSIVLNMLFEFNQLWLLALATPTVWFGTANAAVLSTLGLGGMTSRYLRLHNFWSTSVLMGLLVLGGIGLVILRSSLTIVIAQVVTAVILAALSIVFTRLLHDSLASNIRAGAASAVSTLGRICVIPLAILFGTLSRSHSVFSAAYVLLGIIAVAAICVVIIARQRSTVILPIPKES